MSPLEPTIQADTFERILTDAIVRPAGRSFRGEPSRQVAVLRLLREHVSPLALDEIFDRLAAGGSLRSSKVDATSKRKQVRQLLHAVNDKLAVFFFRVKDIRLLAEMFRVAITGEEGDRPAAQLQDFFGIRKSSGVRFFATSDEPAGGLTRELYELVTEIRPRRIDLCAASFSSFLGNPEFRARLADAARSSEGRMRFLLLDPSSRAVDAIERCVQGDVALRGSIRARIESSLAHLTEIRRGLDAKAKARLEVRLAPSAPLWRFRMIFLPEVLHLRLIVPESATETLIKLDAESSLYRGLHDVFRQAWEEARPG